MPATSVTMARASVAPRAQSKAEQKSVVTLALFSLDRDMGSWERTQGSGFKMRPYGSFREGEHGYVV